MANEPGFHAPLGLPIGFYLGAAEVVAPAVGDVGYPGLLWFWAGGAHVGGGVEEPPVVTPTAAYYMPAHRARRR
jgi:hypothetical protein